jgi:alpha-amylase/alpha-mannosidase (GH57 family)
MDTAGVAILLHMHQPYYRDLLSGSSMLPWVRLHAVKDYHAVARILLGHPGVRVTINYVPSLLAQIREYTDQGLRDLFWEATQVPADGLSLAQRVFLLKNFFMVNWNMMLKPIPRYAALLEKRGYHPGPGDLERSAGIFSVQDCLDLQVLFNLVWFHPLHLAEDAELLRLRQKGRRFTEEEKAYVLARQLALMGEVIPLHRTLLETGQAEISTTPYYHPILPLLIDQHAAWEAMPDLPMPSPPFQWREDADLQLERAVAFHREVFGRPPAGLWPSEGSVSEELIPLVIRHGFSWLASDEEILYRSLNLNPSHPLSEDQRCDLLYRPYLLEREHGRVAIVFRDHQIADAIGFTYGHWDPRTAADDLAGRFTHIAQRCRRGHRPLIPVILDGENPWEYYRDQGHPFLEALFRNLESSSRFRTVTFSQGAEEFRSGSAIGRLFAGSWINHNFQIWIGHPEDRRAWELLAKARRVLEELRRERGEEDPVYRRALEEILIAEGSDWCWWYGEENDSGNDEAFDELYRLHLQNVYTLAGRPVPDELKVTIFTSKKGIVPIIKIFSFINPTIDGRVTSYFEWLAAGEYPILPQGGAMHRAGHLLAGIWFGFNADHLFIRIDPVSGIMANDIGAYRFSIHFLKPHATRVDVVPDPAAPPRATVTNSPVQGPGRGEVIQAAVRDIVEASIPFAFLSARPDDVVEFFISLSREDQQLGVWPYQGYLRVTVPGRDFEEKSWAL